MANWTLTELAKELRPYLMSVSESIIKTVLGNKILLYHPLAEIRTFEPAGAGLTAALATAVSGDVVVVPPGTMTGDFTVPGGVIVVGTGGNTILAGTVTLGASSGLFLLSVADSGTGERVAVVGPASGAANIRDCSIGAVSSDGAAYGVRVNGGSVSIYDSPVTATGVYGVAIYRPAATTGDVYQYGGRISGTTHNAAEELAAPAKGAQLATGTIPGDQGDSGVEVGSLTVGMVYCLESSDGPWYFNAASDEFRGYDMSVNNVDTWPVYNVCALGYQFFDNPPNDAAGWYDVVPAWMSSAERVLPYYYRFYWTATTTSIYLWPKDAIRGDNAPGFSLTYTLFDAAPYTSTVDTWYHASGVYGGEQADPLAGDRSAYNVLDYQARHANDVDNAAGVHHTLAALDARYQNAATHYEIAQDSGRAILTDASGDILYVRVED